MFAGEADLGAVATTATLAPPRRSRGDAPRSRAGPGAGRDRPRLSPRFRSGGGDGRPRPAWCPITKPSCWVWWPGWPTPRARRAPWSPTTTTSSPPTRSAPPSVSPAGRPGSLLELARDLERLPELADALRSGSIDLPRARVVCTEVATLDDEEAQAGGLRGAGAGFLPDHRSVGGPDTSPGALRRPRLRRGALREGDRGSAGGALRQP